MKVKEGQQANEEVTFLSALQLGIYDLRYDQGDLILLLNLQNEKQFDTTYYPYLVLFWLDRAC